MPSEAIHEHLLVLQIWYMRIINIINSFKTIIIGRYAKISIKSNGLE